MYTLCCLFGHRINGTGIRIEMYLVKNADISKCGVDARWLLNTAWPATGSGGCGGPAGTRFKIVEPRRQFPRN